METLPKKYDDPYVNLAIRICDAAKNAERRHTPPILLGDWEHLDFPIWLGDRDIVTGYGERIYARQGKVWYECGSRGTWAAYTTTKNDKCHTMHPEELAALLRRKTFDESENIRVLEQKVLFMEGRL
jgi:hypothetical protein